MFILTDVTNLPYRTSVVETFDTFEAACAYARENFKIVLMEADAAHDGCADIFTTNGNLYTIQPKDFTLAA